MYSNRIAQGSPGEKLNWVGPLTQSDLRLFNHVIIYLNSLT